METIDLIVDELNRCGLHVSAALGDQPGVGIKNVVVLEVDDYNLANISAAEVSFEVGFTLSWFQPYTAKVANDLARVLWAIEQSKGFEKPIKFVDIVLEKVMVEIKDPAIPDGVTYLVQVLGSYMEDIDTKTFTEPVK
jgi:hypothetical protein